MWISAPVVQDPCRSVEPTALEGSTQKGAETKCARSGCEVSAQLSGDIWWLREDVDVLSTYQM